MTEERRSPLVAQVVLLVCFLALLGVGIFTVIIPELSSDPDASDETAQGSETADDEEEEPSEDE